MFDQRKAELVANGLVEVHNFHNREWVVKFGASLARYNLLYGSGDVAESVASHLRECIIDGIRRADAISDLPDVSSMV